MHDANDPIDAILKQRALELTEASNWLSVALKEVKKAIATEYVPCPRCSGKGYDFFLGGSRAPGVCFRCAGEGKEVKSRKEKQAIAAAELEGHLNYLRFAWVSTHKAALAMEAVKDQAKYPRLVAGRIEDLKKACRQLEFAAEDHKKGFATKK